MHRNPVQTCSDYSIGAQSMATKALLSPESELSAFFNIAMGAESHGDFRRSAEFWRGGDAAVTIGMAIGCG
jgi:hypothetical protein